MDATTFYGDISYNTAGYISGQMLARGQHALLCEQFAQAKVLPTRNSKTMIFSRYEALPRATSALAEAVPPQGHKMNRTEISVSLEQFGDFVELTDQVLDFQQDPVVDEAVSLCSEQIAETIEVLRINTLKAGTNAFYANNVAGRTTVGSVLARGDLRRVSRALRKQKAQYISKVIKASAEVATEPVGAAFFALCHTDLAADIRSLPGFIPAENYSASENARAYELGKCEDIRFLCSPLIEPWLNAATSVTSTVFLSGGAIVSTAGYPDVYPIIILAKDSWATIRLQGKNAVTPYVVNPKPSVVDPLGQKGFVAWKHYNASLITNQLWMARLEVCCTAKPN